MSNDSRAVDLIISGHVQGVSYRAGAARVARELSLAGWVQNEADGTVTAHAEGDPDTVESFVDWCHDGPDAADVSDVEVRDVAPTGLEGFEIRR